MIKQFMRNSRNEKVGVIVGHVKDGQCYIGFSKCNTSHDDEFSRELGEKIAFDRSLKMVNMGLDEASSKMPLSSLGEIEGFTGRCVRYFKDAQMPTWVNDWNLSRKIFHTGTPK